MGLPLQHAAAAGIWSTRTEMSNDIFRSNSYHRLMASATDYLTAWAVSNGYAKSAGLRLW
jgi:hypothetical protein